MSNVSALCTQCPWRSCNQGKPHPHGFYTKANLTRLWNGIRRGNAMSCHPTDPRHPGHGAKADAVTRECPGSVVLILREFRRLAEATEGPIEEVHLASYLGSRRKGLTKAGIAYWLISRYQFGGQPFFGGPRLPEVKDTPDIALPAYLEG